MLLRIFTTWGFAFIPSKSPRGTWYHINYQRFSPALIVSEGWPWDGGDSPRHVSIICWQWNLEAACWGGVGGVERVSASNKQILNSDERPWEGVQGRKALRRGKPMFICNHICDVWQHDSGGGRRGKKIPTAALEHLFFLAIWSFEHFRCKGRNWGARENGGVDKSAFFCVCVCFVQTVVPDIHFQRRQRHWMNAELLREADCRLRQSTALSSLSDLSLKT